MSVWFQYGIGDQVFTSAGRAEDIGRTFDSLQIGETVPISYDSTEQSSAVLGNPEKYLFSSLRGTGYAFVGLLICFLLYVRRLARRG